MAEKSDDILQLYLDTLRDTGDKLLARKASRCQRRTIDAYREMDEQFREAEQEAIEEASSTLEQHLRVRGTIGTPVKKFHPKTGEEYIEHRTSDTAAIFLLKGLKPDTYADRQKTELTGANGGPVILDDTAAAARLASILEAARLRKEAGDA